VRNSKPVFRALRQDLADFYGLAPEYRRRYTETYLQIHERAPSARSAIATDRGIEEEAGHTEP
jgi:hypothetical protein